MPPPSSPLQHSPSENINYAKLKGVYQWAKASLIQSGHDADSGTMFPSYTSSNTAYFMEESQATPAADTSQDLGFQSVYAGGSTTQPFISPGVIYDPCLVARAVSGTMTAQWYVDGVARGSTTTFSSATRNIWRLPQIQYTRDDYYAELPLTLRLWGGTVRAGPMMLISRAVIVDCHTIVDTADGASTAADSDAVSGTVAVMPTGGGSYITNKKFLEWTSTLDVHDVFAPIFFRKWDGTPHGSWAATDYDSYADPASTIIYPQVFGASNIEGAFWTGFVGHRDIGPATAGITPDAEYISWSNSSAFGIASGSKIAFHSDKQKDTRGLYDQMYLARRTGPPGISSPAPDTPQTVIAQGAIVSVTFTIPNYADDADGYLYDSLGAQVDFEAGITSPWSLDTSPLADGEWGTLVVVANYSDGSYGWDQRELIVGGVHLLPLTGAGPS